MALNLKLPAVVPDFISLTSSNRFVHCFGACFLNFEKKPKELDYVKHERTAFALVANSLVFQNMKFTSHNWFTSTKVCIMSVVIRGTVIFSENNI